MKAALIDTEQPVAPRKKRERIQIMEMPPREEWFQKGRDSFGREVWFVRVEMTGLRTRRYGPFPTKHKGLLFLDHMLNEVADAFSNAEFDLGRYQVPKRCFGLRAGHYPVVEDELCSR
ncbi:MAG: hypothetical protein HZC50_09605 [Nitrospirae bacterium]|nr:hypothetical protein [Nitrospirota bacterium]